MTVITISRQFGSGGNEIADHLCQVLSYRHFDKSLIAKAAGEAGISDQELIDYSEENYKIKHFFDRLFGRPKAVGRTRAWKEDTRGVRVSEETFLTEEHALSLVQKAVEMAYRTGNMVIEGRGGQVLLKNHPDVLHIRIEAPMEDRIQRVKAQLHQEKNMPLDTVATRRAAQDMIVERDAASADYLKRFYSIDWSDPLLYHAVLNTGKLSIDQVTHCIVEMLHTLSEVKAAEPIAA